MVVVGARGQLAYGARRYVDDGAVVAQDAQCVELDFEFGCSELVRAE
jgi:hypothetical protein